MAVRACCPAVRGLGPSAAATSSATPSVTPSVSRSSPCPTGSSDAWTWYIDDGTEGFDSCFLLSSATSGSLTGAAALCPPGSHLITFGGSEKSSGLFYSVISTYQGVMSGSGVTPWVGCKQSIAAARVGEGWSWIDGTDSTNLNCDVNGWSGCNLWNSFAPNDGTPIYVLAETHLHDACAFVEGFLLDVQLSGATSRPALCEYDLNGPSM